MSNALALPSTPAPSDALSILNRHFAARTRIKIEIRELPFPVFFAPANGEQAMKLAYAAREKNAKTQARSYAEMIIEMVTTEDGQPAFPLVKGGLDPVKTLTTGVAPEVFTALCMALLNSTSHNEAGELEKK